MVRTKDEPILSDYETEEEYEHALRCYEEAWNIAEDEAILR